MTQAAAAQTQEPESTPEPIRATGPKKKGLSTLAKLKQRGMEDESGAGGRLRRRKMKFTLEPGVCDPGAFDEDFELVLVSASTQVEMDALKVCGDNPGYMMQEMVKQCIVSIDGEPVRDGDGSRDLLWEALGTGGRSLVSRRWHELCGTLDASALKKAEQTTLLIV